ncbi:hypothetical protein FNV43_RR06510 [Rhamnella rubrinervis]|uniref:Pentatricopeptide repeat-containing protein n=1 Tax=Rhamnella rubrinervis TaxID=2594499 RepID=A0A8K0HDY9_9ROSA|nr:hypothetical protein FNV43_RR06510 [Rhamnella rubrinervis]
MKVKYRLWDAIDLFYACGTATSESYTQLGLECVQANDVAQAKRLQSHMDLHLFQHNGTFLYNRLLHLYVKCGKVDDARKLFGKMQKRDVISWNAMLFA